MIAASGRIARWRRRAPEERRAFAEAFATLIAASLIVRFGPFRWVAAIGRRPVRRPAPPAPDAAVDLVAWAVTAAARRARFRAVCIERGLAAQTMLRRRGVAASLHYGVARLGDGLTAHVWVRWRDRDVTGGAEAPGFSELAVFTPEEAG